jgi:hypothetical protein
MTSRQQVVNLLRGKETHRIRFSFPASGTTLTINSGSFDTVAQAVEDRRVTVEFTTNQPDGVGAQYSPANTASTPPVSGHISSPPLHGRAQRLLMIHECTHAFFDLTRTSITAVDDEAASYVVAALYGRMTGLISSRWTPNTRAARTIVEGLLRHYATGAAGVPSVNAAGWDALRWVIMTHPIYANGPAGFMAQLLPFLNDSYTHDG